MELAILAVTVIFVIYAVNKCNAKLNADQLDELPVEQEGFRHYGRYPAHHIPHRFAHGYPPRYPLYPNYYVYPDLYRWNDYVHDDIEEYETVTDSQGNERLIRRKIKYY